jgi:NTP pyrophosphatase (non-canonical NTP hydrolase)
MACYNKAMTMAEYQKYVEKMVKERGFANESVSEIFMLFLEEAGEFAKAARKSSGIKTDKNSKVHDLEEEAADVFWYLLDLCNHLGIDLEKAFEAKEKKNQSRQWY